MRLIKETVKKYVLSRRHKKFKKCVIQNPDVTIFCNCCIGGAMYNDLGLQFLSPTINLFFGHHSFIDFVMHYEAYATGELIDTGKYDINENGLHGPVCMLRKNGLPDIEIHFLHYSSFEEAKEKWESRFKRINKEKIFLVIEAMTDHEHLLFDEYAALPYPKIIFTNAASEPARFMKHMSVYDTHPNKSVTSLIGLSGKRGYDEYDFVNEIFNRIY